MEKENTTRILELIKKTNMPIGATYLSKELNIPPATIGRILTVLEGEGLLIKVGNKGRQITDKGIDFLFAENSKKDKLKIADNLINLVEDISKQRLLEIIDVRKLLECKTIELACQNRTEDDLIELENIILEYRYVLISKRFSSEHDLKLHLKISEISKNMTIYQILKLILTEENAYTKFSVVADHIKKIQINQHEALIEAIKEKDSEKGKKAMLEHLNQVAEDIELYYE